MQHTSDRWADVITLGNARFGQLHGGPFDGRCFPLGAGTPEVLHVPVEGSPPADGQLRRRTRTLRYELRDGRYRFVAARAAAAA